jgi:uncharacterized delta-60 repeat protein
MKIQPFHLIIGASFLTPSILAQQGALDPTFDFDGKVITSIGAAGDGINAIALQPDGKILVAGYSSNGTNNDFALVRYTSNGILDSDFSSNGKVLTDLSGNDIPRSIALQPDGKILVAGWTGNGLANDFALVRYSANGDLDHGFATEGKAITPIGAGDDRGYAIVVQPDGKIVVAGYTNNGSKEEFVLVRYNVNGTLDISFDTDGKKNISIGNNNDRALSIALQPDGKIVLAGYSNNNSGSDFALARCNPDGSLDASFGVGGIATTSIGIGTDVANSLILLPDGKIVTTGYYFVGTKAAFALVRYLADGSLDQSFNIDGIITTSIGPIGDFSTTVLLQPDGKYVVVGYSEKSGGTSDFAVTRYNVNGSLDNSFNSNGIVTTSLGSGRDEAYAATIQPDGKILLAGRSNNGTDYDFAMTRYLASSVGISGAGGNSLRAKLYPNPTPKNAVLEYSLNATTQVSLKLLDTQGKIVKIYCSNLTQSSGVHLTILELPNGLNPGVYSIVLSSSDGRSVILNVVKSY